MVSEIIKVRVIICRVSHVMIRASTYIPIHFFSEPPAQLCRPAPITWHNLIYHHMILVMVNMYMDGNGIQWVFDLPHAQHPTCHGTAKGTNQCRYRVWIRVAHHIQYGGGGSHDHFVGHHRVDKYLFGLMLYGVVSNLSKIGYSILTNDTHQWKRLVVVAVV